MLVSTLTGITIFMYDFPFQQNPFPAPSAFGPTSDDMMAQLYCTLHHRLIYLFKVIIHQTMCAIKGAGRRNDRERKARSRANQTEEKRAEDRAKARERKARARASVTTEKHARENSRARLHMAMKRTNASDKEKAEMKLRNAASVRKHRANLTEDQRKRCREKERERIAKKRMNESKEEREICRAKDLEQKNMRKMKSGLDELGISINELGTSVNDLVAKTCDESDTILLDSRCSSPMLDLDDIVIPINHYDFSGVASSMLDSDDLFSALFE